MFVIEFLSKIISKGGREGGGGGGGGGLSDKKTKNNKWEGDYYLELESIWKRCIAWEKTDFFQKLYVYTF